MAERGSSGGSHSLRSPEAALKSTKALAGGCLAPCSRENADPLWRTPQVSRLHLLVQNLPCFSRSMWKESLRAGPSFSPMYFIIMSLRSRSRALPSISWGGGEGRQRPGWSRQQVLHH